MRAVFVIEKHALDSELLSRAITTFYRVLGRDSVPSPKISASDYVVVDVDDTVIPLSDTMELIKEINPAVKIIGLTRRSQVVIESDIEPDSLVSRTLSLKSLVETLDHYSENTNRPRLDLLTPRERAVALAYGQGKKGSQIAEHLGVKPSTVSSFRKSILRKLELDSILDVQKVIDYPF